MRRLLVLAFLLSACGGDDGGPPIDAPDGDILEQLRGLDDVAEVREQPTQHPGYRYFELQFRQPVDHDHPEVGTFSQYATLIHTSVDAPMVIVHTGYGNWYYDYPSELTRLLHANQIVVEHRFFRGSRPDGGPADWARLTIEQSAADHHVVAAAMHRLYHGSFLETGASKGGMTSVYHRRFHPDDVDATVAYVAPISFDAPDYRYDAHLDTIGTAACRNALHAVQRELLRRRGMLMSRATAQAAGEGYRYDRVPIAAAVESAVSSVEWAFWQYIGVQACASIPAPSATDDALWEFLERVSNVSGSDDDNVAEFEAYYYQAAGQLGFPGTHDDHLTDLLTVPDEDYAGSYPLGVALPAYSMAAMQDVDAWVKADGERLLFLYGEYDPWSGGMFELGGATDSLRVVAPGGAHGSIIRDLAPADRDAALARLAAWSGVTPDATVWGKPSPVAAPKPPRPPPFFVQRRDTNAP